MGYLRLISRRLLLMILTLWGLVSLVFIMIKLIPGNEAQVAAGPGASLEQIAAVTRRMGLDLPISQQYLGFIRRVVTGDFGASIMSSQPVLLELSKVLPSTLELIAASFILGIVMAIPAALVAATYRGGVFDTTGRVLAMLAGAMPAFWMALMLQYQFGSVWRLTPISGQHSFGAAAPVVTYAPTLDALLAGDLHAFGDAMGHLILPAFVFSIPFACQVFRVLRASMIGVLASDMVMPVRAKGASVSRIVLRHAFPNSVAPMISLIGTQLASMVEGAILIEIVFARRGVGSYLASAVSLKDTFAVLGSVIFIGIAVCVITLVCDVINLMIDPRIRDAREMGAA